LGDLVKR
jgi:hypothetical protein